MKVSTVAFGTDHGSVMVDFMSVPVPVDRAALRDIAEATGGKAFEADSAEKIVSVFEDIGEGVGTRTEPREITDGLALAALVAALSPRPARWPGSLASRERRARPGRTNCHWGATHHSCGLMTRPVRALG